VFALSKKIKLNMVEERVVTFGFSKDTTITFRGQQSTSQPCSGDGGNHGGQVQPQSSFEGMGAHRSLSSFVGQQQGQSCWTCGGAHIRRDCPQESGGRTLADGYLSAQVQCDNYGQVGHLHERCFDLYPQLRSGRGGGRGGVAQKGRGGISGRSTPTVGAPPMATPPPMT